MKFHIATLGCKLNRYESQVIAERLIEQGHQLVSKLDDADLAIINTCTVTQKADNKSRQLMRRAKKMGKFVVATGCYANTDYDVLNQYEYTDLVVRQQNKFRIAEILNGKTTHLAVEDFPKVTGFERTRASLKIQDGCDKYCSYCKIPLARGQSRSLAPNIALETIYRLISSGYKEIVLTGVNISSYCSEGILLADLVDKILKIPGEFRLRLSSLQPDEFDPKLISFLNHSKFAPHFHISLQSGSDSVLKRMKRHYTADFFLKLTAKIRKARPDTGITTDIMVGFPGESEQEFEETLELVREVQFTRVHIFPYSPRKGTVAATMQDLPLEIKRERQARLKKIAIDSAMNFINKNVIGTTQRVLIETINTNMAWGYTGNYLRTFLKAQEITENTFIDLVAIAAQSDKVGRIELISS